MADDCGAVVAGGLAEDLGAVLDAAALGVVGAEVEAAQAGQRDGLGTHGAGLGRDPEQLAFV